MSVYFTKSLNKASQIEDLDNEVKKIIDLDKINDELNELSNNKADSQVVLRELEDLKEKIKKINDSLKNLSGANFQDGGITSDKITITDGFIKDAMIEGLSAGKITSGSFDTTKADIVSENGNLIIKDNTIQIRDTSKVRVQIGKDASGDYNMYVWDVNGNLMFNATGITANAIKNKIIRDDMVSDNANIDGKKLNIESLIREVNNSGSTIKASKINLDNVNQTLEIAFKELSTENDNNKKNISSALTKIEVQQGQIETSISNSKIIKDKQEKLENDYNNTVVTVNSIKNTIGQHTTLINNTTGKVESVESKTNTLEKNLDSVTQTIQETKKTVADNQNILEKKTSELKQSLDGISASVGTLKETTNIINKSIDSVNNNLSNDIKSNFEKAITTAENLVLEKSNIAKKYADDVAAAKAELAKQEAIANSDGKIDAEEKARIQQAQENLNTAISKADKAKQEAILEANRVAELKKQEAINLASQDASNKANNMFNSAKAYTNTEISTVNNNISKATSEINILKDKIESKVSQSDIDKSISEIKFGGRNLIIDRDKFRFTGSDYGNPDITTPGKIIIKNPQNGFNAWVFIKNILSQNVCIEEPYCISIDLKANGTSKNMYISLDYRDSNNTPFYAEKIDINLDENWNRFTIRMKPQHEHVLSEVLFAIGSDRKDCNISEINYKNIKLEKGTLPTADTEAPEDLNSFIVDKIKVVTDKVNIVESTLIQKNNSIEASVKDLNSTTQTITTNVSNINIDLTNKINTNLDAAKNFATTKANNAKQESIKYSDTLGQQLKANAEKYANDVAIAKSNLAKEEAIAAADGKISEEEKQRIQQAQENLNTAIAKSNEAEAKAKAHADQVAEQKKNEALENSKSYTNAQITTVNGNIHNVESNLSILRDKISTKVSQEDINNSIKNIKFGGRNLALQTQPREYSAFKGSLNDCQFNNEILLESLSIGDPVTISFKFGYENLVPLSGAKDFAIRIQGSGDVVGWNDGAFPSYDFTKQINWGNGKSGEIRVEYTYVLTSNSKKNKKWFSNFRNDNISSGKIKLSEFMVEYGTHRTSYVPAPEDIEKAIVDSKTEVTEKINKVSSELNQTKDSISASVKGVQSETQKITTNIVNLDKNLTGKIASNLSDAKNFASQIAEQKKGEAITDARKIPDTRSTNENPSWYIKNYPNQTITEFKYAQSVKIPTSGNPYGTLETKVPWNDASGGYPTQIFRSNSTPTFQRHGVNDTSWSDWEQIENTSGSQAKVNAGIDAAKQYTNAQVSTVNQKVSSVESGINILKDQIKSKVSQVDIDRTVNSIQFGDVNMLINAGNFKDNGVSNHWGITNGEKLFIENGYLVAKFRNYADWGCYIQNDSLKNQPLDPTKNYTVVVKLKANKNKIINFNICDGNSSNYVYGKDLDLSTSWKIFKLTFKPTGVGNERQFRFITSKGEDFDLHIGFCKMVEGSIASDSYSPSPEDVNLLVDTGVRKVDEKINKVSSELTQTKDSITASINSVQSKTNTIESNLNGKANKQEVNDVNSKVTTIEANLNGISQRVGSTETQTKAITTNMNNMNSTLVGKISSSLDEAKKFAGSVANQKKSEAISAASTDASNKANAAKEQAIADSKNYINTQVSTVNQKISSTESNLNILKDKINTKVGQADIDKSILQVKTDRVIYARGTGNDYPGNSYVRVGSVPISDGQNRGLRVIALNPSTLKQAFLQDYDTFGGGDATNNNFANKINELNNGNFIIIVTSQDASYPLNPTVKGALEKIGATLFDNKQGTYREAYALIGKSKLGRGNGVEMFIPRTANDKRFAEVSVKVGEDGTFIGLNPNNLGLETTLINTKINDVSSSLEQTKNSITASINSINSKTSSLESNLNGKAAKNEVSEVNNKVSSIQANVNGITQRVSNTESKTNSLETIVNGKATKEELTTTNKKVTDIQANVNGITQRVSSAESKINTIDGKVNNAVTNEKFTEFKQSVDNFNWTVGQRSNVSNLLPNSTFEGGIRGWQCGCEFWSGAYGGYDLKGRICAAIRNKNYFNNEKFLQTYKAYKVKKNTTYTINFHYVVEQNVDSMDAYVILSDSESCNYVQAIQMLNAKGGTQSKTFEGKPFSFKFNTGKHEYVWLRFDHNGMKSGSNVNDWAWIYISEIGLYEGDVGQVTWSAKGGENYSTRFTMDEVGLQVNYNDGSYTSLTKDGFEWYNAENKFSYHALTYVAAIGIPAGNPGRAWVKLPKEFTKRKDSLRWTVALRGYYYSTSGNFFPMHVHCSGGNEYEENGLIVCPVEGYCKIQNAQNMTDKQDRPVNAMIIAIA
ncbi:interleukin-like EMT inducer domain-containing protein (plasmid) [Clostridium perfringens]